VVNAPEIQAMMDRVDFAAFDRIEPGYANTTTFVDVELEDGRLLSGRADFPKGSPQDPMTYDDVAEKFQECADYARWPSDKADRVVELVHEFEVLPDMKALSAALSAAG